MGFSGGNGDGFAKRVRCAEKGAEFKSGKLLGQLCSQLSILLPSEINHKMIFGIKMFSSSRRMEGFGLET